MCCKQAFGGGGLLSTKMGRCVWVEKYKNFPIGKIIAKHLTKKGSVGQVLFKKG